MVAAEFGVEVSVDGDVCWGGCAALDRIRASEELRDLIADAEVVVVQPQPGRFVSAAWRSYSLGDCGGEDGFECFRRAEEEFRVQVEELLDEVVTASRPGTIVRAMRATGTWVIDLYNPGLSDTDPDLFDAFLENVLSLSNHVAEAAADRCILALDVNAIMSGPDYRQPLHPDYSNDGSHPSEEGSRVIAEALRDLGFQSAAGRCDMPGSEGREDAVVTFDGTECISAIPNPQSTDSVELEITNEATTRIAVIIGTYNDGFARDDLVAYGRDLSSRPAFISALEIYEVGPETTRRVSFDHGPGCYFTVCMDTPSTGFVLDDLVVG
jgi:hypothetical protein